MKLLHIIFITSLVSRETLSIYKGNPAGKHEFPYQVAILLVNESIDDPVICSGAILNPSWIIGTASCLTSHVPENLHVVGGTNYVSVFTNYEHRRVIKKVVSHPDYDGSGSANAPYDVALAELRTPFDLGKDLKSVKLPEKDAYPSGSAVVAGFGANLYLYMRPNDLMKSEVRISHKNGCIESAATPMFCATHSNNSPICKWDDGAPLVQKNENGELILIGIAAVPYIPKETNKCPTTTQSSKFAMVSQMKEWIENNSK